MFFSTAPPSEAGSGEAPATAIVRGRNSRLRSTDFVIG
jgi:hypothetical protein